MIRRRMSMTSLPAGVYRLQTSNRCSTAAVLSVFRSTTHAPFSYPTMTSRASSRTGTHSKSLFSTLHRRIFLPSDVSHPYSDWETLAVIAEHGGHLERLGLYLNSFAEVPPRASMPSFLELIQLKIGMSKLPSKTKEAARFLSQLLTLQCRVHCAFMSPDRAGWGALSELLESFIRTRMEELESTRTRV